MPGANDISALWLLVSSLAIILVWWPWISGRPWRITSSMITAILSWLICYWLKEPSYFPAEVLLAPLPAAILLMGVINLLMILWPRRRAAKLSGPARRSASSPPPPPV